MTDTVAAYGIREQTRLASDLDRFREEIEMRGFAVVASGHTPERIAQWRAGVDAGLMRHAERHGGRQTLLRLGEADTLRAVLVDDPSFLDAATDPTILALCRLMLGPAIVLMQQNAVVNRPEEAAHHQAAYHRDLPYQHYVASRPLAISALLCIDDFLPETGGTVVLPGSHKAENFPSAEYIARWAVPVSAPAGSYIVFDSMLFHRTGTNTSSAPRRGVNHVYTVPLIKQQIDLPRALGGRWSDNAELATLLGYDSQPAESTADYLNRRARKLSA